MIAFHNSLQYYTICTLPRGPKSPQSHNYCLIHAICSLNKGFDVKGKSFECIKTMSSND